ncbi:MAG: hypothetical protein A2Y15_06700 [Clostridiales bacterium GWF2_36_10]|nr:MAG: hypothetical protein A2Y15_06700 [Clostridiales bacterium GWF2_36_10]HAN21225.1 creatininase [Clostridiales bacterium]
MNWENLNVLEFEKAIEKSKGVCVLPIGCLEKHGNHLPLGTDIIIARHICEKAALIEDFVLFPYYPFGQVSEVRHKLGTIALSAPLQMQLLEAICEEIYRNGFNKIILANGHGGNNLYLSYFAQSMLDKPRDYDVYTTNLWTLSNKQYEDVFGKNKITHDGGHADVTETSQIMAIEPTLVNMDLLDRSETASLGRNAPYGEKGIFHGIGWYADYPHQIAGDPIASTPEFGKDFLDCNIKNLVEVIKLIKNDTTLPSLAKEFFEKSKNPTI